MRLRKWLSNVCSLFSVEILPDGVKKLADSTHSGVADDHARGRRRRERHGLLDSLIGGATEIVQSVANEVAPGVVGALDVDEVVQRVDVQAIVDKVDIEGVVDKVDVQAIVDKVASLANQKIEAAMAIRDKHERYSALDSAGAETKAALEATFPDRGAEVGEKDERVGATVAVVVEELTGSRVGALPHLQRPIGDPQLPERETHEGVGPGERRRVVNLDSGDRWERCLRPGGSAAFELGKKKHG